MFKFEKTTEEKRIEKQKAFDYCVYMMFSSYYKKAKCLTPILEEKLFLYYKDLNEKQAIDMENEALTIIEKQILPNLPETIELKDAHITILPWSNTYGYHGIQASTNNTVTTVYIKKEGKKKTTVFTVK